MVTSTTAHAARWGPHSNKHSAPRSIAAAADFVLGVGSDAAVVDAASPLTLTRRRVDRQAAWKHAQVNHRAIDDWGAHEALRQLLSARAGKDSSASTIEAESETHARTNSVMCNVARGWRDRNPPRFPQNQPQNRVQLGLVEATKASLGYNDVLGLGC
jgi:hypothetical protein